MLLFQVRSVKPYILPIYLIMASIFSFIAIPFVAVVNRIRKYFRTGVHISTPDHLILKTGDDKPADKQSNRLLNFLTSTTKKNETKQRRHMSFSSDDDGFDADENDVSNLSSSQSVLASVLSYSDDDEKDGKGQDLGESVK